jgi:hypothetical protein
MSAKVTVSTYLDEGTVHRLDAFCKAACRTRTEVLRGLLDALLVEGKQTTFEKWREQIAPSQAAVEGTAKSKVLCALKQFAPRGTKSGSLVKMLAEEMSRASVYRALNELCKSGEVEMTLGQPLVSGVTPRYFRLSQNVPPCAHTAIPIY